MKLIEHVIAAGGIGVVAAAIGTELYMFLHWILQQPGLYHWSVQLY